MRLNDIGVVLRDKIVEHFRRRRTEVTLKYIDPSYHIRSVPASPADSVYCWNLARNAVHAAMAGNTGMLIGRWHGRFVHVPMPLATRFRKQVTWQATSGRRSSNLRVSPRRSKPESASVEDFPRLVQRARRRVVSHDALELLAYPALESFGIDLDLALGAQRAVAQTSLERTLDRFAVHDALNLNHTPMVVEGGRSLGP